LFWEKRKVQYRDHEEHSIQEFPVTYQVLAIQGLALFKLLTQGYQSNGVPSSFLGQIRPAGFPWRLQQDRISMGHPLIHVGGIPPIVYGKRYRNQRCQVPVPSGQKNSVSEAGQDSMLVLVYSDDVV
jgi:hypothetical protein